MWSASNLSTIFVVLHTHLYGFHVLFPCTVVHEPPYQTYSSVWCAGFRRCFPRMNDRTDSTLVWGSLRLAPKTGGSALSNTDWVYRGWMGGTEEDGGGWGRQGRMGSRRRVTAIICIQAAVLSIQHGTRIGSYNPQAGQWLPIGAGW